MTMDNISSVAIHQVQGEYDDKLSLIDILSPILGLYCSALFSVSVVEFMEIIVPVLDVSLSLVYRPMRGDCHFLE